MITLSINYQIGDKMKITRRQLKKLISETIFAGGPTVDSPDKSVGVTVDMGRQASPKFRKEYERDKAIRKSDPRLADLMKGSEEDQEMARVMADQLFGIPEEGEPLNPEEEYAQGLYDEFQDEEFEGRDIKPRRYRYHDTPDERLQRSYASEIKQLEAAMTKKVQSAIEKGFTDYDDLYMFATELTPGYGALKRSLYREKKKRFGSAVSNDGSLTGAYGGDPSEELDYMPMNVLKKLGIKEDPYY